MWSLGSLAAHDCNSFQSDVVQNLRSAWRFKKNGNWRWFREARQDFILLTISLERIFVSRQRVSNREQETSMQKTLLVQFAPPTAKSLLANT